MALFALLFGVLTGALLVVLFLLQLLRNSAAHQVAILLAALGASWIMTKFVNRKPLGSIGIFLHPRMPYELGMGLLLGFVMMAGIFLFELALGYVSLVQRQPSLPGALASMGSLGVEFTLAGSIEEFLFRGYLFQTCLQGVGFLPATLLFSGSFALAHVFNPEFGWLASFNIFLAGVWLSVAYMRTRSLWFPIALHIGWNFSQSAIFSFPTSGLSFADRTLFLLEQSGPVWVTGGAFGPEAGVVGTVAILLCTWHILKSRRYTSPEGVITLDSLEDLLPAAVEGGPADGGRA